MKLLFIYIPKLAITVSYVQMGETPRGILNVTVPLNDKWYFGTRCICRTLCRVDILCLTDSIVQR